jgi:hypothetical protein
VPAQNAKLEGRADRLTTYRPPFLDGMEGAAGLGAGMRGGSTRGGGEALGGSTRGVGEALGGSTRGEGRCGAGVTTGLAPGVMVLLDGELQLPGGWKTGDGDGDGWK